jgi:hypothetical protein
MGALPRITTTRYTLHSSIDVDLVVEASSWERALWLGLQLLEREDRASHLVFTWRADGGLICTDDARGEVFVLAGIVLAEALAA